MDLSRIRERQTALPAYVCGGQVRKQVTHIFHVLQAVYVILIVGVLALEWQTQAEEVQVHKDEFQLQVLKADKEKMIANICQK